MRSHIPPASRSWRRCGTARSPRGSYRKRLGVEQANLSQHLAILRSRQIVANRKEGNQVFYSLRNKALVKVLDMMRRYFQAHLAEEIQMLGEIEAEGPARRKERLV
jgi:DNA-binding transcriptional ArsR family regulator